MLLVIGEQRVREWEEEKKGELEGLTMTTEDFSCASIETVSPPPSVYSSREISD